MTPLAVIFVARTVLATAATTAASSNGSLGSPVPSLVSHAPVSSPRTIVPSSNSSSSISSGAISCTNHSHCPFGWDCNTTLGICLDLTCTTDAQCHGQVCDETTGTCVNVHSFCQKNADCSGGQFCNTATRECVSCTTSAQCVAGTECDGSTGECVEVTCHSNQDCVNVSGSSSGSGSSGGGSSSSSLVWLVCDPNLGTCVDAAKLATSRGSSKHSDSRLASLTMTTVLRVGWSCSWWIWW